MTIHRPSPPGPESIDIPSLRPPFAPGDAAGEWLFRLQRLGIRPGLDAIRELLEAMGRPDRSVPSVVVAGTNGKGGSAIALANFCRAAGLRTGLYTSPHLLDVRERIVVDGEPISARALFALVSAHRSRIEATRATFFESLTAIALAHFATCEVDVAILEAGLGGRLDATNAVDKLGVVLTSIGHDHEDLLGGSLESIAREKLGLAAAGVPFYVAPLAGEGLDDLARRTLARVGAEHVALDEISHGHVGDDEMASASGHGTIQRTQIRSMLAVYRDLQSRNEWPDVDLGVAFEHLRLPARFEAWGRRPRLILDTAHNSPALERTLAQWSAEGSRGTRILVIGAAHGKSIEVVLPRVVESAATILVTAPRWYRAVPATEYAVRLRAVADATGADVSIDVVGSVRATLEEARARGRVLADAGTSPSVLVTGSNFLVAEALDRLGVDDLWHERQARLWDEGAPLRQRTHGSAAESAV